MSITDDVRGGRPSGQPQDAPPPQQREGGYDKTPPQDVAAEQSVLGGMLLSKDAIADVVEILKTGDFYRPIHATVFDAILDLYGRGEPADAVTVAASLADAGDLVRIGGAPYLQTLMSSVPTAANAGYYARIVAERAVLRRLVEAGTRIVQLGYGSASGGGRDVDDVVDLAQQAIYDVTEKRVSEDFAILADMLQPTLDEIEAVGAQGGVMTGVPTGFTDLDRLLNGLHAGQLVIVAGRPGLGKALALDTPLPTPDGWTTMGEVRVGDLLIGASGRPTRVTHAFEVMHDRPCFEVEFSDGAVLVADADHLWKTVTRAGRRQPTEANSEVGTVNAPAATAHPPTVTTAEIRETLRCPGDGRPNHGVENTRPLSLAERDDLAVPPYTLGVWLSDGPTDGEPEIVTYVEADGFVVRPGRALADSIHLSPDETPTPRCSPGDRSPGSFTGLLRQIGVLDDKHIPPRYLRGSERQRRELLAGLLDTDGTVTATGNAQFRSTSRRLADDVHELVVSLGYRCSVTTPRVKGREAPTVYTLDLSTVDDVFRLERKRLLHKERRRSLTTAHTGSRFVVDVRPVASVPVRCVSVDNDDHLYLAGRAMIPTHNSTASMDFARNAAIRHNCASAIFSLEMSKVEIVMRLLSAEARVPLHVLRSGQLSDDDWTKLARRMGEISEAPLFVDDTPNMTLMEIRAKARRLKQRHDLKMIVVDYLQLMSSPKRTESRQQEVAELSRGLKLLAKEVECPVIAVSQLNRGPEQRTDKRPQLSDLRESGCLTAGTRVVRADTNAEVTLGELLASGARDIPVWALDERLKYTPRTMTHVFPSGRKETFRLRLASGKEIEATANHPFLTVDGWLALGDLSVGSRVGVPRHVPAPTTVASSWADEEVVLLAHLLGDGTFGKSQPIRSASVDEEAHSRRHHVAAWLDGLGLFGLRSHEKFVPTAVAGLEKRQVRLFLRHIWSTGGSMTTTRGGRSGRISFDSTSRRLIDDLSRLLLRFGITSRIRTVSTTSSSARFTLDITDRDDQLRFLREIGGSVNCAALLAALEGEGASNPHVDTIPVEVWSRVRAALVKRGTTQPQFAGATQTSGTMGNQAAGRQRLARVAQILDDADLELHATNDIFWDAIVAIEPLGPRDVFDATVLGTHNFIANGIATHNSIEQDADVVILLHRDDYYDKESPRAGEADFIVAKHRNGPTDTVTVAAQLHLSRFVDMAI